MDYLVARRVIRPKLAALGIIEHDGVQILRLNEGQAFWRRVDERGVLSAIPEPVIDYCIDRPLTASTLLEFSAGKTPRFHPPQKILASEFDARLRDLINDKRLYSLLTNDCQTTATKLLTGKRLNRQLLEYGIGTGIALLVLKLLRAW